MSDSRYVQIHELLKNACSLADEVLTDPPEEWDLKGRIETMRTHIRFAIDDANNLRYCNLVTKGSGQCIREPRHKGRHRDRAGLMWEGKL